MVIGPKVQLTYIYQASWIWIPFDAGYFSIFVGGIGWTADFIPPVHAKTGWFTWFFSDQLQVGLFSLKIREGRRFWFFRSDHWSGPVF